MRYGAAGLKVDSTVCDKPLLGGNCMRCTPRLADGIGEAMRAVVYHGPGQKQWEEVADPKLVDDGDAIVRVDATTICGTDLHILKGDVPAVTPGRILGHEAVGTVMETGPGVRSLREGDRVLMSCISACGRCRYCRVGQYGQCIEGGGWIFGHLIDGVQAEYARVPFADTSTYRVPQSLSDEQVLYLADILPTGYEVGVLNGRVQPGDVVAVVGAGPVGLAAVLAAKLFSPAAIVAIDPAATRRDFAMQFGADIVVPPEQARAEVDRLTDGLGVDTAIEAVGIPATFEQCTQLVRPGGRVANVGVHGEPVTLHLEELWIKNVTITTGLVDSYSTPTLLKAVATGRIETTRFTTHRFPMAEALAAYDTFSRAAETNALKVLLTP
jgi:alcohol dehydrogenase